MSSPQPVAFQGRTPVQLKDWRQKALDAHLGKSEAPSNVILPATPGRFLKAVESEDRVLRYIISSDSPDRYNDVVIQEGGDYSEYHNVVLWAHDYGSYLGDPPNPPIGMNLRLTRELHKGRSVTISDAVFAGEAEAYPLAETCYLLARKGFIPDCSIGFDPMEWTYDEERGGFNFIKWGLLEWSLCPIGAQQDAQQLRSVANEAKIDLQPLDEWARKTLDLTQGPGLFVPRAKLEEVVRGLGFSRGLAFFDLGVEEIKAHVTARRTANSAQEGPEAEQAVGTAEAGTASDDLGVALASLRQDLRVAVATFRQDMDALKAQVSAASTRTDRSDEQLLADAGALLLNDTPEVSPLFDPALLREAIRDVAEDSISRRWTALTGRLD